MIGFSQSTCLPASRAAVTCSTCNACGEATYTASIDSSASSSSYEPYAAAKPNSSANAVARAWEREPTAASSAPGTSRRSAEKERAMRPGARTAHRVTMTER